MFIVSDTVCVTGCNMEDIPYLLKVCVYINSLFCLCRLLHLAIIHEAKDYIRAMIDLSRNTNFLNRQNDQRQVWGSR